jgi:hypothetical protein
MSCIVSGTTTTTPCMASHTKPRQHERLSGWWGNPQYLHFSLSEFQIISAKVCIWHACMTRFVDC